MLDRTLLRRYTEHSEREILRPGFARVNLSFYMSESEVDFVLAAVCQIAQHGWKLLPQYIFNPETGEWKHLRHQVCQAHLWLVKVPHQLKLHRTIPEQKSYFCKHHRLMSPATKFGVKIPNRITPQFENSSFQKCALDSCVSSCIFM